MGSNWRAGVTRRVVTPSPGVELAGLGYYLERAWRSVRDDLCATAVVVEAIRVAEDGAVGGSSSAGTGTDSNTTTIVLLALDLMYNSAALTAAIRAEVQERTGILGDHVCVNISHSHNAPTAGFIRGAGEVDCAYVDWVARQAADAVVEAFEQREPVRLYAGESRLEGMTFNRTRENGPVDTTVGLLRVDRLDGSPLAVAVNFHSHCTAYMECDLFAVSRDWPGDVVDQLETALPGCTAMYLQGVCGDVNFRREYNGTERRAEPARAVAHAALNAWQNAREIAATGISASVRGAILPTRPWTTKEIEEVHRECEHRLCTGDTIGWLHGFARVVVNQPERLPLRYGGSVEQAVAAVCRFGMEWAEEALAAGQAPEPESNAEVQALRIGDLYLATCPGELFTSLGLTLRARWGQSPLFILGYSNGSIGYIPDAHDVDLKTYAAVQSPKFTAQQPFTPDAGTTLVDTMLAVLHDAATSVNETEPT